jgi:hypothetical protein
MEEMDRQLRRIETTLPDDVRTRAWEQINSGNLHGCVRLLNEHQYKTGRHFQVTRLGMGGPLSVTWEKR